MPTIVKWKYVKALMAELQKPEYKGLSDKQIAAALNAPIPTGKTVDAPPVVEERALSPVEVADVYEQPAEPEQVPELGPSFAQEIGIGEVFLCNVPQLRVYIDSGDEDEIKYDLAGHILSGVARRARAVNPDVTTEEIMETETYKLKAALVEQYTEVADAEVHEAVLDETLQVLRGGAG